jgi:hypothetical protein
MKNAPRKATNAYALIITRDPNNGAHNPVINRFVCVAINPTSHGMVAPPRQPIANMTLPARLDRHTQHQSADKQDVLAHLPQKEGRQGASKQKTGPEEHRSERPRLTGIPHHPLRKM